MAVGKRIKKHHPSSYLYIIIYLITIRVLYYYIAIYYAKYLFT